MMKRLTLSFLTVFLLLSSCTTNYYLTVSDTATPIYSTLNDYNVSETVTAGKAFIYSGQKSRNKTTYGKVIGYTTNLTTWKKLKKLSRKQLAELAFVADYGYTHPTIPISSYNYGRLVKSYPSYSPSTTTKSTISSGGTVQVKGYTRKDGTYVKPHTRSAPRRKN